MAGSRWWYRSASGALLAVMAAGGLAAQVPGQEPSGGTASSGGRILITLRTSGLAGLRVAGDPVVTAAEANRISTRLEGTYGIRTRGRSLRAGVLFADAGTANLPALAADPEIAAVEPDVLTFISGDARTSLGVPGMARSSGVLADAIPWGVTRVGAESAWAGGVTGTGVKVGIIDSGIDPNHPDLNVVGGFDFTTGSGASTAYADNVSSCNGHGTHVAGTVAARRNGSGVVGVAPDAQLYALKVFEIINGGCAAWSSNQIAAIDWAVANGLRVVNISIASSTALTAYQNAINTATAAGVLVVAAAGNNSGGPITYPAAYNNAVAVGALTSSDQLAYFSNVGPQMWVSAPGSGITSTMPGGGTGSKSGTSMAAPHVAGVAALLVQLNPGWSATQVRDALRTGALDVAGPGWDSGTGWGLVKAPAGSGGGGGTPLTLVVSPSSRSATVQQGGSAPADQAAVNLSGTNASTTVWSATKRKSWTTLTAASGTGNGSVAWSRNASGLAAGTYVDTITVTVAGAVGSPAWVIDTLVVTSSQTVTLAVSPTSRSATVQQGSSAPGDSASVAMSGTNAWQVGWTATKRKPWTTLTTASGSGNGKVRWSRNATGLAAGTYVDTITVTAAGASGSPARVIDTLVVTGSAPQPLALAVTPSSRSVSVQQGAIAPGDQATVSLTGTNAATTAWTASARKAWTSLTSGGATGSGTLAWNRTAAGLAPGIYVDTITVSAQGAAGSPARVIDTLIVTAVDPLVLAILPGSRRVDVSPGNGNLSETADLIITGAGATTATWTATSRKAWTNVQTSSGTGSAQLRWQRRLNGLTVGTYVDTITVTAGTATARVIDSLVISTGGSGEVILSRGGGKKKQLRMDGQQTSIEPDSVVILGLNGGVANGLWTAREASPWILLETNSGGFPGVLRWNRTTAGLSAGTHVDSIQIELLGDPAVRAVYVDSVQVVNVETPTPAQAADALFRGSSYLTADQRVILDDGGNRNGQYDLGDFLAWVERSNIRLSAGVMARVQAAMDGEAASGALPRSGDDGTPPR